MTELWAGESSAVFEIEPWRDFCYNRMERDNGHPLGNTQHSDAGGQYTSSVNVIRRLRADRQATTSPSMPSGFARATSAPVPAERASGSGVNAVRAIQDLQLDTDIGSAMEHLAHSNGGPPQLSGAAVDFGLVAAEERPSVGQLGVKAGLYSLKQKLGERKKRSRGEKREIVQHYNSAGSGAGAPGGIAVDIDSPNSTAGGEAMGPVPSPLNRALDQRLARKYRKELSVSGGSPKHSDSGSPLHQSASPSGRTRSNTMGSRSGRRRRARNSGILGEDSTGSPSNGNLNSSPSLCLSPGAKMSPSARRAFRRLMEGGKDVFSSNSPDSGRRNARRAGAVDVSGDGVEHEGARGRGGVLGSVPVTAMWSSPRGTGMKEDGEGGVGVGVGSDLELRSEIARVMKGKADARGGGEGRNRVGGVQGSSFPVTGADLMMMDRPKTRRKTASVVMRGGRGG